MYAPSSRSYLGRAQREHQGGDPERLFYAALELRAGIEARLKEYLEHAYDIPEKQRRKWRIASLDLSISKAFGFRQFTRSDSRQAVDEPAGRALLHPGLAAAKEGG